MQQTLVDVEYPLALESLDNSVLSIARKLGGKFFSSELNFVKQFRCLGFTFDSLDAAMNFGKLVDEMEYVRLAQIKTI